MVIFKNKGAIDVRAIKIIGVSVKKKNAIGFFGTGLKYAIAILLREGCSLSIWSGGEEFRFTTKRVTVTGQEFDVVCMNGEELGFTTELGKTWKLWQAFRELYCNCTDEGGSIYGDRGNDISCGMDETVITVEGDEIDKVFLNVGDFILQDPPNLENKHGEIRLRPSHGAFYKGVRVKDAMGHCMVTYNIKDKIDLTEDRTAKYDFQVDRAIASIICTLDDPEILERLICAPKESYEGQLDYDISVTPSELFLSTAKRLAENQSMTVNLKAVSYARKFLDMKTDPTEIVLTPLEQKILDRADELLRLAGFDVRKHPRKFVQSLGTGVLAQAKLGTVYISKAAFIKGTKLVAHALLEETWHLEHGFEDETRAFQTFLFDNVLTLIERVNQEAF